MIRRLTGRAKKTTSELRKRASKDKNVDEQPKTLRKRRMTESLGEHRSADRLE